MAQGVNWLMLEEFLQDELMENLHAFKQAMMKPRQNKVQHNIVI